MNKQKKEFLEMLSNYQNILHKVNLLYFRNKSDREDNFQEIVYQLWKSYPKLKNKDSIGSWIYSVSINTSISNLKRTKKIEYKVTLPELPDTTDAFEKLTMNEDIDFLLKAIYKLNEIDKSIILLYLDEKSYDEVSEITGMSKSNVGVRINRAKKTLKQNLKHLNHEK